MNVLWICNILFPEAYNLLTGKDDDNIFGGWLLGAASVLVRHNNVSLTVAAVSPLVRDLQYVQGDCIAYYILPYGKGNLSENSEYEVYWRQIQQNVNPEIIHIHGTEMSHGLAYVNACGNKGVVVSIQGLTSEIAKYYTVGLKCSQIIKCLTIKDIITGGIFSSKNKFHQRGEYEIELIKKIQHVIGRTSWDKTHILAINNGVNYHFCNETLRSEFYTGERWQFDKCERNSIFLSQCTYPIKGFHILLKALPLVLKYIPDIKVIIAGPDICTKRSIIEKLKQSGYSKILKSLIKEGQLEDVLVFKGSLSAEEMKRCLLKSNLFICPSTIENSPNSLAEAQILGVPVLASFVGGIPDMIPSEKCGYLYRVDDCEELACRIKQILGKSKCFDNNVEIQTAENRHNPESNNLQLVRIYKQILNNV